MRDGGGGAAKMKPVVGGQSPLAMAKKLARRDSDASKS